MARAIVTRLIILALILVCVFGLYVVVTTAQDMPLQQAQAAALNRYGEDLIRLCKNPAQAASAALPSTLKLGVVDSTTGAIFEPYLNGLPAAMQAKDKSDINVMLCLREDIIVFDTDQYGSPPKYTCTRYERDILAYLVDAKTGKTLGYRRFEGAEPPDCPDKTDTNVTRTGDLPPAVDVNQWLANRPKNQV